MDKSSKYTESNSIVIDLTYRCNAKCKYCQWGNNSTPGRIDLPDEYIYIPHKTLESLKTNRIVFSGGEPVLHKGLENILHYYKHAGINEIIIISNGLLLNEKKLNRLVSQGLTGITFSLDSINHSTLKLIRSYNKSQVEIILSNFKNALKLNLEMGINCVLSKGNIYKNDILELISFANAASVDFLKFSPIFNDGYVEKNAPYLILNQEDANRILDLKKIVEANINVYSNDLSFWDTLYFQLQGYKLTGSSCGLSFSQQIAIRNKLKFCFWIDEPNYGDIQTPINKASKIKIQKDFDKKKVSCKTGMYCHCLQKMSHQWEVKQ